MTRFKYGLGITQAQADRVAHRIHENLSRASQERMNKGAQGRGKELATIPSFPNIWPFNELLLTGKLDSADGRYGVKTRTYHCAPKNLGWRVLYTSKSRIADTVAAKHGLTPNGQYRGLLVGVGFLEYTRELDEDQSARLACQFSNVNAEKFGTFVKLYGPSPEAFRARICLVGEPLPVGWFFRKDTLHVFKKPVPYSAPPGAVRTFCVPLSIIARPLKELGVTLS